MKSTRTRSALRAVALIATAVVAILAALDVVASGATTRSQRTLAESPAAALYWNTIAVNTVRAPVPPPPAPQKAQIEGLIYMSYVQASVYDAVTKIEGRYQPYHDFTAPVDTAGASPDAAVAAASYTALAYYFPAQAGTLGTTYTTYLGGLPAAGRDAGAAIGVAAANDIIALRTGDGRNAVISTPYGQGPVTAGVWTFAPPPSAQSAQTPWVAFTKPFMLESPSQFRPGPPLDLDSHKYAVQLAELHDYGSATGSLRTEEQTNVAQFWNAFAVNQINQEQHDLASTHGFDLVETVRGLAMANMVDSDAGIACFDAKYHYTFWRPATAIPHADIDGNDLTTADPAWTPLLTTPNHPEYPSAHGCVSSAVMGVLASVLKSQTINIDVPGATGGGTTLTTTQHFNTTQDLLHNVADARVWAGLHYRFSTTAGVNLGAQVSRYDLQHNFQPATK